MATKKLNPLKMRHERIRKKVAGTPERPRLAVHFSGKNIYAQIIDDEAGKTLGGLSGVTYWRWLYIQLFWLPEPLRGAGLGSEILASAEAEARARGCVDVWLDSFSFQAPGFYQRHGYRSFGTLDDYPPGQRRVFLTKRLG